MHYFAFLDLEQFYVSTLALQGPTIVHLGKRVLDVSDDARALGVGVGMVLAEAKAVARGVRCTAWEEEPFRAAQAAWLDVCAEFSDAIEPERQHAAWVDLSGHPDAPGVAVAMAEMLEARLGYRVRLGLARTKWIAEVAARAPHPGLPGLAGACEDPAAFLAPLEVEWLLPALPEHRERLRFLGYRTIGEVAALPYRTLEGQFAAEGRRILDAAQGRCFEPVRAVYPPDALLERFVFEGATEDLGVLDAGLQVLARRIAERLEERDRCGAEMRVWIEREEGPPEERARRFVHPLRSRMSLLAALRAVCGSARAWRLLHADRATPDPSGVRALGAIARTWHTPEGRGGTNSDSERLAASELAHSQKTAHFAITALRVRLPGLVRSKRVQPELHSSRSAVPAEQALDQVRAVFGDGSVVRGNEVAVPRRVAVLKAWRDALGWS